MVCWCGGGLQIKSLSQGGGPATLVDFLRGGAGVSAMGEGFVGMGN